MSVYVVRNKAFSRGFAVGFASPYQTVFGRYGKYHFRESDLVKAAWTEVGRALRDAIDKGVSTNGETADHSAKTQRR